MLRILIGIALTAAALASVSCSSPSEEPLTLAVFTGSRAAGEVVMEWTGGAPGVQRWQYRSQGWWEYGRPWPDSAGFSWDQWFQSEWKNVPPKRTRVTRYRVRGLEPRYRYTFQVRPRTATGAAAPSEPAAGNASQAGPDGVVYAYSDTPLERGGQFRLRRTPYVFTVPARGSWTVLGVMGWGGAVVWFAVGDEEYGRAIDIHPSTGREIEPYLSGIDEDRRAGDAVLDRLLASVRFAPEQLHQPLVPVTGGGAGELILEWTDGPRTATHWQYRWRESDNSNSEEWSDWSDLPGSEGPTRSHRLTGLAAGYYDFEVRPWTEAGPGTALAAGPWVVVPRAGPEGIPYMRGQPESGRTFLLHDSVAFDVPDGMRLMLTFLEIWDQDETRFVELHMIDLDTGSWQRINRDTEEYLDRYISPAGRRRGVDALFDMIVASTRRVQSP